MIEAFATRGRMTVGWLRGPLGAICLAVAGIACGGELAGEWQTFGGLRNGCDQASSIEDAVALPDGDLIVIGDITQCVDTLIPHEMARFDVQTGVWSPVPGFLRASAQNRLHRAGNRVFVTSANNVNRLRAEGLPDTFILQLDLGTGVWSIPGGGVDGGVLAMTSDGDSLYAGGGFATAGGTPARRLARYDLEDERWHALGDGADDIVSALAMSDGWLYAGGRFTDVGGVSVNHVARMQRASGEWKALGTGLAANGSPRVDSIAVSGSTVYVAGWFNEAGGVASERVAAWTDDGGDGVWSAIGVAGSLSTANVWKLIVHATGLYAAAGGTSIHATQLARWIPPASPPGTGGGEWEVQGGQIWGFFTTPRVTSALLVGDDIYQFGNMYFIGDDVRVNGIARFATATGTWHALGDGRSQGVTRAAGVEMNRIRVLRTVGDQLVAGGYFEEVGGVRSDGFAVWDGVSWADLSSTFGGNRPYSVGTILPLGDNEVIVEGSWRPTPNSYDEDLARCRLDLLADPATQNPCTGLRGGTDGYVYDMLEVGDEVIVAGWFDEVGIGSEATRVAAPHLAKYDLVANTWSGFGSGVDGYEVNALVRHGDDVYVGGYFTAIDGVPAQSIARLDLTTGTWHALGDGLASSGGSTATVTVMAVLGNDLYVGGGFVRAGGAAASNIARWSPATEAWSPLDAGLPSDPVSMFAEGPVLYVGGRFTTVNGSGTASVPAEHVAAWDSDAHRWLALPGGGVQTRLTSARVSTIERYRGAIHLGGSFSEAGNLASRHFAAFVSHPIFRGGFESVVD